MENGNGQMVSAQVSMFGPIPDLTESNFKLDDGSAFLIKNEGSAAVKLEVIPPAQRMTILSKSLSMWVGILKS
jgi:hypothetical protein